jgi:hypothetical protein
MKIIRLFILMALILSGCKGKETEQTTEEGKEPVSTPAEKVLAVSVFESVPVRAEPKKKGKYLTSLNLGETMKYLGETVADSNEPKRQFYKVELSDGTVAWARTYGVIVDATPAAIISETPIYKRPDLVNKTSMTFHPLEFVVIVGEKEDWVEVNGVNKKKKGWIKKQYLKTKDEDVAVSTLAYRSILSIDGGLKPENVTKFLDELPYKNTAFDGYLQSIADEQVNQAVEESIENYEDDADMVEEVEEPVD